MTPQEHAHVKKLFLEACAHPTSQRGEFLRTACGGNGELRAEVERLLAHHDGTLNVDYSEDPEASSAGASSAQTADGAADRGEGGDVAVVPPEAMMLAPPLAAGVVVAGRYRIVSRVGSGGMGDVYRADDLRLRQPVALKFLPPECAADRYWRSLLEHEVRIARAVSHPNLCRVHDLVDDGGRLLITMEFIDGDDLGGLLKRIGRLPRDKAIDVSRQLCAALAALHARGILHRDLKPANVMIDARGQVRITDFGLAAIRQTLPRRQIRAGTPAYMAPEQLAGRDVSIRSDLYALGLILYEVFSGRFPFDAEHPREISRLKESVEPAPLGTLLPAFEPHIDHVILRCLRPDPVERPGSAIDVAVELLGDDLLSATLAAGELPTPELLALAGERRGLRKRAALLYVAAFIGLLIPNVMLSPRTHAVARGRVIRSPGALREQSQALIRRMAPTVAPADEAWGLTENLGSTLAAEIDAPGASDRPHYATGMPGDAIFWHRSSPRTLQPKQPARVLTQGPSITPDDPPPLEPGIASMFFSGDGRLVGYENADALLATRPPPAPSAVDPLGLLPLLDAAGTDETVRRDALRFCDSAEQAGLLNGERFIAGPHPADPSRSARYQFYFNHGHIALFAVTLAPESAPPESWLRRIPRRLVSQWALAILVLSMLAACVPAARKYLRRGGSDERGAFRLAAVVFVIRLTTWLLNAHLPGTASGAVEMVPLALAAAAMPAAIAWLFYLVLEPAARRYWPHSLIAWARLLSGRIWDPAVGASILCGAVFGAAWAVIEQVDRLLPRWFGGTLGNLVHLRDRIDVLGGARPAAAFIIGAAWQGIYYAVLMLLLLTLTRRLTGRAWPAKLAAGIAIALLSLPLGSHPYIAPMLSAVMIISGVWLLTNQGLVATAAAVFVALVMARLPLTLDPRVWYADYSLAAFSVIVGLMWFGYSAARSLRTPG